MARPHTAKIVRPPRCWRTHGGAIIGRIRARAALPALFAALFAIHAGTAYAAKPATAPSPEAADPFAEPSVEAPELMLFKEIPVVVAAGKREQTESQAAASVSVVSADQIDKMGYRSLADVLRGQRSFYLHSDGLNSFAGVRGFLRPGEWNARILVLVDGRPTREPVYAQTHLDQDFVVPMEAIKRVEVVRGPGSALYGSNAVFAVINVVTKDGADVNGGQIKVKGGNKESGAASGMYGTNIAGWDVIGAASGFTTAGDKNIQYDKVHDAARNFGHIVDFDHEDAYSAFAKARKGDFTIELDLERRKKDNRSATYLASWFDPGRMLEDRANLTLKYDHRVNEGQSLHAMAYVGYYNYDQKYRIDDAGAGQPFHYRTQAESEWVGAEIHYDWQIDKTFHLTVGADGTQSLNTRQHDSTTVDGNVLDVDPSFNSWGIFAEGEWKVAPWLTLTAGLRLDHVQRIDLQVNPRAAAIITPTKEDTIKLMYGRAFRAPNLYELFYASPGANTPNPGLNPEICDTWEIAWERQFKGGWRTSVNYYYWRFTKSIESTALADDSFQYQNGGNLYANGVELELQKQWEDGTLFRIYGTYGRATHSGGGHLSHSPDWIAGTSIAFPIFNKKTFLAIEPQVVGPMRSDDIEPTDATFITNIILTSREIAPGMDLQLGAYNLFSHSARMPRNDASTARTRCDIPNLS